MDQRALDTLLARRLLIVTGKGGTGKTTLCAALGRLAAERGLRTLLIELGDRAQIPALLGRAGSGESDGRSPLELAPNLAALRLIPTVALAEYMELAFRLPTRVDRLLENRGFRRLLDAAPGWRELITLGKIWHLATRTDREKPRYDLLIVDAPATGHGLSLLSVPRVVFDTVRVGPLRRHTEQVHAMLIDPERCCVLTVSLPEELPVRETLELVERVRELGMHPGPVVMNGLEAAPELAGPERVIRLLRAAPSEPGSDPRCDPHWLAEVTEHALGRFALQQEFCAELRGALDLPMVSLPFLVGGARGLAALDGLARGLARGLAEAGAA